MTDPATNQVRHQTFAPWVWAPLAAMFLGIWISIRLASSGSRDWTVTAGILVYVAGLFYFLVQLIGRCVKRHWKSAAVASVRLFVCMVLFFPATGLVAAVSMLTGPSEDHFADNLTIPIDLKVEEPLPRFDSARLGESDGFQAALLSALTNPAVGPAKIVPSIPSLTAITKGRREMLERYLASSPAWRVFEERGSVFATRRMRSGTNWVPTLHGYYSHWNLGNAGGQEFQFRVTIGLDGKAWVAQYARDAVDEGTNEVAVPIQISNSRETSFCEIRCGPVMLEIMEESSGTERRLTKACLRELENEFARVLAAPKVASDMFLREGMRHGQPDFNVRNDMQPGIYTFEAWINPGERGGVYLKAFEVTKGTRLSEERLARATNELVGYSEKPEELFMAAGEFTIYEGDWGKPYSARVEFWFRPAKGGAERKLMEKVYKVEGWQR